MTTTVLIPATMQHPATYAAAYVPVTGGTVSPPPGQQFVVVAPAGTLATLTVALNVIPHGETVEVFFKAAITALTLTVPTGYTIDTSLAAPTAATAGQTVAYRVAGTVFYRTH